LVPSQASVTRQQRRGPWWGWTARRAPQPFRRSDKRHGDHQRAHPLPAHVHVPTIALSRRAVGASPPAGARWSVLLIRLDTASASPAGSGSYLGAQRAVASRCVEPRGCGNRLCRVSVEPRRWLLAGSHGICL